MLRSENYIRAVEERHFNAAYREGYGFSRTVFS